MSYIVCRNCKRFIKVDDNLPLVFDKCENCGHTQEFAGDEKELHFILNGIKIPEISYYKVCSECKSSNPRETGACLYCGSTSFHLQYDADSIKQYEESVNNISQQIPNSQVVMSSQINSAKGVFKLVAVILGIVDFFFFSFIGLGFIVGNASIPATTEALIPFVTQHLQSLLIVIVGSLIISGVLSVFVLPRMSYIESFKVSSLIGVIVGLITLLVTRSISVVIFSVIFCAIISGIGGLVGELIAKCLVKRLGGGKQKYIDLASGNPIIAVNGCKQDCTTTLFNKKNIDVDKVLNVRKLLEDNGMEAECTVRMNENDEKCVEFIKEQIQKAKEELL